LKKSSIPNSSKSSIKNYSKRNAMNMDNDDEDDIRIDFPYSFEDLKKMDPQSVDDLIGDKEKFEKVRETVALNTSNLQNFMNKYKDIEPVTMKHIGEDDRQRFSAKQIGEANSFFSGKMTWRPIPSAEYIEESELPEVCFIGRSNVGKSSLLNALVGFKAAKVGKTPGKTQMIHHIEVGKRVCLVDLPGYGFARVSKDEKKRMSNLLDTFIGQRERIDVQRIICFLVDIRHQLRKEEHHIMNQLDQLHSIYIIVLTKADKVKSHDAQRIAQAMEKNLQAHPKCFPEIFVTSASDLQSLDRIKATLHRLCEQLD
jgi:GTP-binding protein